MVVAIFAVAVFAAALMASLGSVSRVGYDLNASASVIGIGITGITVAQFMSGVVWSNIVSAASVFSRRSPLIHKRLMVFASISVLGPALARIAAGQDSVANRGRLVSVVTWSLASRRCSRFS